VIKIVNCCQISYNVAHISIYVITELPLGWEEVDDPVLGKYFIDHNLGTGMYAVIYSPF
jgi:hypothetical protein